MAMMNRNLPCDSSKREPGQLRDAEDNADNDESKPSPNELAEKDEKLSAEELAEMDDAKRKFLRKRNAMYSKKNYYRKKNELKDLENWSFELRATNFDLRRENARLESLMAVVKQKVFLIETTLVANARDPLSSTHLTANPLLGDLSSILGQASASQSLGARNAPTLAAALPGSANNAAYHTDSLSSLGGNPSDLLPGRYAGSLQAMLQSNSPSLPGMGHLLGSAGGGPSESLPLLREKMAQEKLLQDRLLQERIVQERIFQERLAQERLLQSTRDQAFLGVAASLNNPSPALRLQNELSTLQQQLSGDSSRRSSDTRTSNPSTSDLLRSLLEKNKHRRN